VKLGLEEVALRLLCAHIQGSQSIGSLGAVSVREAFALALAFEEQAKEIEAARKEPQPRRFEPLSYDDDGQ
jgi:hypothetical protein